jgi:transposase
VQAAPKARAEKLERRASETDPEARIMKQSDGGHAPSHNVQISTDVAHGLIVGVSVTQEAHDYGQLSPALEEVQRQTGRLSKQMVVDDGYTTRENILAAAERGVDLLGGTMEGDAETAVRALERRGLDPAFYPQNFRYHAETNTYTCPAGKELPYLTTKYDRVGVKRHVYRARLAHCRGCAFRERCRPGIRSRTIVRSENVPEVATYVAKMRTEAAKALYRVRAPVAEFTNAWLKAKLGLRQFCVRSLKKARCEVLWACLTYNIQQWFRLRWKVRLVPTPV